MDDILLKQWSLLLVRCQDHTMNADYRHLNHVPVVCTMVKTEALTQTKT